VTRGWRQAHTWVQRTSQGTEQGQGGLHPHSRRVGHCVGQSLIQLVSLMKQLHLESPRHVSAQTPWLESPLLGPMALTEPCLLCTRSQRFLNAALLHLLRDKSRAAAQQWPRLEFARDPQRHRTAQTRMKLRQQLCGHIQTGTHLMTLVFGNMVVPVRRLATSQLEKTANINQTPGCARLGNTAEHVRSATQVEKRMPWHCSVTHSPHYHTHTHTHTC